MPPAEPGALRYADLLLAASEELRDLAGATASMQASLGELLRGGAEVGQPGLWRLQEIDRIQQTLEDLSAVLRRAAEATGPQLDADDLARVTRLGSVRARLRGIGPPLAAHEAGTVAMF